MFGTTSDALRTALASSLASDPRRVVLTESTQGLGGSLRDLATAHPEQVLLMPIADRATMGMALGMALAGRPTVVEITSTGRLLACLEVLTEAATIATQREFPVPLVVRVAAGGQAGDRIDVALADQLASIDGLAVVCSSSPAATLGALQAALPATQPTVLLEPRAFYARRFTDPLAVQIGQAQVPRSGDHVTLVSWGSGVQIALDAADDLAADGISAAVVDLVALRPLDCETLGSWVRSTGRMVCVEAPEGGLTPSILQASLDEAFLYLESPLATCLANRDDVVRAARSAVFY